MSAEKEPQTHTALVIRSHSLKNYDCLLKGMVTHLCWRASTALIKACGNSSYLQLENLTEDSLILLCSCGFPLALLISKTF